MEFTPSKGDELQSEDLIPREHAAEAIRTDAEPLRRGDSAAAVGEIRFIAADELWLSPNYGRDGDRPALHLAPGRAGGQVHPAPSSKRSLPRSAPGRTGGKLFHGDAISLAPLYPRLADFTALADRLDSDGKFRNAFLDRTVAGR